MTARFTRTACFERTRPAENAALDAHHRSLAWQRIAIWTAAIACWCVASLAAGYYLFGEWLLG